jgi:hypothetical protein
VVLDRPLDTKALLTPEIDAIIRKQDNIRTIDDEKRPTAVPLRDYVAADRKKEAIRRCLASPSWISIKRVEMDFVQMQYGLEPP